MSTSARAYRQGDRPAADVPGMLPDPFEEGLRKIARALRESVAELSPRETEFLYDLARDERRYPMPTVRKLCGLSRRSRNPLHREALAELIRLESTAMEGDVAITAAFDIETPSTGPADIAQRHFERDRNPITYARVKAALEHQIAATQVALLSVVRWGAKNGLEMKEKSGLPRLSSR